MISALLIFLATVIGVMFILWYIQYLKYEKFLWKFSGPRVVPIIGNLHHFGTGKDLLPSMLKNQKKYGEVMKVMFGYAPKLFLSGPKWIEILLNSNSILDKSGHYNFFHQWLGMGLLTSSGSRWRESRKFLTPAFHFKILEQFTEIFEFQANILLRILDKFENQEVNITPHIRLYTLDVICEATMNTAVNAQLASESQYVQSVNQMCTIINKRIFSIFKMWDFLYQFTIDYQIEKKAVSILHAYTNSVIKRRQRVLEQHKANTLAVDEVDEGCKKRMNFLDLLLQCTIDGIPLPNERIREEVNTFMFEGHDTTTAGISFTLYCLSKNLDVQNKVYEELQWICEGKIRSLTYHDLQQMKYLEHVIKESLRLYPPIPAISRVLTEDTMFDGTVLPKGLTLVISIFGLHRRANLFPNPELFDPERFNLENVKDISLFSYVPFSAGPRNCIGQRFVMLEIKATVAKILMRFKLLPVIGHKPDLLTRVTLESKNGLPIRLQKREH